MRTVVSTNFVFETDAAKLNLWFTPALILTFSPGRRNTFAYFRFLGSPSGKSRRANFQGDCERFPLSSEERAGVRTVV